MGRNMTIVKEVSGTELVNAYFTMVRSDISKSVASLRVRDDKVFAETCDNLAGSMFLAATAMMAYSKGADVKDARAKLDQMYLTKAMIINRMSKEIADFIDEIGLDGDDAGKVLDERK